MAGIAIAVVALALRSEVARLITGKALVSVTLRVTVSLAPWLSVTVIKAVLTPLLPVGV